MLMPLMSMMKGEAYDLSVQTIQSESLVISLVGENPEPGFFVLGEISYNDSGDSVNLNYSIKGAKAGAEVYAYATNLAGQWELQKLLLVSKETGERGGVLTRPE
jgi:hypothetical protein